MLQKVIKTIEKYNMLSKNDGIVVGISGGPDSITLLHMLKELSIKQNYKIFAAHINHNLRGKESDQDQAYVKQVCEKWNIPLSTTAQLWSQSLQLIKRLQK
jgi:tRNA(Ile)-lysidine synthase